MGDLVRVSTAQARAEAAPRRLSDVALLAASIAGALLVWQLALKLKAMILALPLALIALWILLIPVKLVLATKLWRWVKPRASRA